MPNPQRISVLIALWMATTSCWFQKPPVAVFTPPPPQAQPPAVEAKEPPVLPEPPVIQGDPAAAFPPATEDALPPELGPPPAPPPRRPVAAAPPKPAPPPVIPADPTPAPTLRQIFTADQMREYNRTLDESLDRVRKALAVVAGKGLNAEQNESVNRIRTFQKQAEQAREQDLVTAVSLARRADLLAKDLLSHLP